MELTITTDRSKQWSRTLYVVDEEIFARIFQILKEMNVSTHALCTCGLHVIGAIPDDEPCPVHGIPAN